MVLWKSSYLKKTQILKCNYEIIFFPKYVCCFIKNVKVIPEDLSLYTYRYIDCLYSVIICIIFKFSYANSDLQTNSTFIYCVLQFY